MGTSTRKQREIQEREELILDVASKMLVERGFNHLTMRLSPRCEYFLASFTMRYNRSQRLDHRVLIRMLGDRVAPHTNVYTIVVNCVHGFFSAEHALEQVLSMYP